MGLQRSKRSNLKQVQITRVAVSTCSACKTTKIIADALFMWPMVTGSKVNVFAPVYECLLTDTKFPVTHAHVMHLCSVSVQFFVSFVNHQMSAI